MSPLGMAAAARRPQKAARVAATPLLAVAVAVGLGACVGAPTKAPTGEAGRAVSGKSGQLPSAGRSGGYYLDDGPGDNPPPNLDALPDAVPRAEPLRPAANRPYEVFGRTYVPMTAIRPHRERGVASWYGRRYHGKPTSSGETYDMYGMTAAHPTLPIPSYARVTNVETNRTVVVRVNDRGPFLHDRVIDLSYAAAYRIGTVTGGSGTVDVELLVPEAASRQTLAPAPRRGTPSVPAFAGSQQEGQQRSPQTPAMRSVPKASLAETSASGGDAPPRQTAMLNEVSSPKGVFLQLGAFSGKDNATGFLARVRGQAGELPGPLEVALLDGLYRVQSGPYSTDTDAREAASTLASRLGIKAIVTAR